MKIRSHKSSVVRLGQVQHSKRDQFVRAIDLKKFFKGLLRAFFNFQPEPVGMGEISQTRFGRCIWRSLPQLLKPGIG
jgi:hypothetical protein